MADHIAAAYTNSDQLRSYAATRNEKLQLLARQRRSSGGSTKASGRQTPSGQSSSAGGRSAGGTPKAGKVVRLSAVLQQAPQHFDSMKVAAVEKMLTDIDELPHQFQTAEVLYVSKNYLTSLEGVQQFSKLRVLSAADNLLQDLEVLSPLVACPNLQVASFERNPLAALPNYRMKVLQMLPNLQALDGQAVTAQEHSRVAHALQQEAACMAVMLSNACMVHKLARTAELLQLHTELRRTVFGPTSLAKTTRGILPSYIPLDLLKFLKLWDYEGSLSSSERRIILDALTREVVRVHKQLQHAAASLKGTAQLPALQAWDTAFSQVMLAQQRTIIQLVELVNVLHAEAAALVSKLTGQAVSKADEPGQQAQLQELQHQASDQALTADQQMAHDRENLIIDLRDAALELANLVAVGEGSAGVANMQRSSSSGQGICSVQQQQQQQVGFAAAGLQHKQQQQRHLGAKQASAASPGIRRRSSNSSLHESLRLRSGPKSDAGAAAARSSSSRGSPLMQRTRSAGSASLSAAVTAAGDGTAAAPEVPTGSPPERHAPFQSHLGRVQPSNCSRYEGQSSRSCSPSPTPQSTWGNTPPLRLVLPGSTSPAGNTSPIGRAGSVGASSPSKSPPLSPTAARLLQHAQQQQQEERQDEEAQALLLMHQASEHWRQLQQLGSAQHLLAALEGSPANCQPAPATAARALPAAALKRDAASGSGGAMASPVAAGLMLGGSVHNQAACFTAGSPRSLGCPSSCSSPKSPVMQGTSPVGNMLVGPWGSHLTTRPTSATSWQEEQQLQPRVGSNPPSPHPQATQQSPEQQQPLPTAQRQQKAAFQSDLADLATAGIVYERIERFSPANLPFSQPVPMHAGHVQGRPTAASAPASPAGVPAEAAWQGSPGSPASEPCYQPEAATSMTAGSPAVARQLAAELASACAAAADLGLEQQQQHQEEQHLQEEDCECFLDAAAMAAAAEAAAEQLFAVDAVPGACSMYSPYVPGNAVRHQQPPSTNAGLAAANAGAVGSPKAAVSSVGSADLAPVGAYPPLDSTAPAGSPTGASVADGAPTSDAIGMLELSEMSGFSNPSPSSGICGGQATSPYSMIDNALYSAHGDEARSDLSDTLDSARYSSFRNPMADECSTQAAQDPGRASDAAGARSARLTSNSPGAHEELSFALNAGSRASSASEPALWLAGAAPGQQRMKGVGGILGPYVSPQQQRQQQQQRREQHQTVPTPASGHASGAGIPQAGQLPGQQQQQRQLLWNLLQSDDEALQHKDYASHTYGASGVNAAETQQVQRGITATEPVAQLMLPAAAGPGYCASSIGSFSSSIDLSPIRRQLFNNVSLSCRTLAQGAVGLGSLAAQLDAAAGAGRISAARQSSLAQEEQQQAVQHRLLNMQPPQAAGSPRSADAQSPRLLADSYLALPYLRKRSSTGTDATSDWTDGATSPDIVAASAAAAAAISAAEAAATACIASAAAELMQEAEIRTAAEAAAAPTGHAVLPGLSPIVPAAPRSPAATSAAASSPAIAGHVGSPRPAAGHGAEAVVKALFHPAAAAGSPRHPAATSRVPDSPGRQPAGAPMPAAADVAGVAVANTLGLLQQAQGQVAASPAVPPRPSAASLPASPAPPVVQARAASASVPASPAAAAPGAMVAPRSPLGPRSTAALADLQSQLLVMAVEKAALQRQVQHSRVELDRLQEKASKSQQLEQAVQQMRGDLQQATHLLEQTGGAAQQQAQLNKQLQEQMQQLQAQLWAADADCARQTAADTLAKISLCRRVMRHYAAAAAAAKGWRQLKEKACQRGQELLIRCAWRRWQQAAKRGRALAAIQQQRQQRVLAGALAAWAQAAWEQKVAAAQEAAALSHWATRACSRALAHWCFYAQQTRLYGVQLPSSPSTATSSTAASPEQPETTDAASWQQQQQYRPLVGGPAAAATSAAAAMGMTSVAGWPHGSMAGKNAVRSLAGSFGTAKPDQHSRKQQQQHQFQQGKQQQHQASISVLPGKLAKSAKSIPRASLLSLTERLSGALSSPVGNRRQTLVATGPCETELSGVSAGVEATGSPSPRRQSGINARLCQRQQQHEDEDGTTVPRLSSLMSPLRLSRCVPQPSLSAAVSPGVAAAAGAARRASVNFMVRSSGALPADQGRARGMSCISSMEGAPWVPLALQASFVGAAKSQRLRRRWLLVKAFARWQKLLEVEAAAAQRLAAAGRHASRRLQRRAWAAWQQYVQHRQQKQPLQPYGVSHALAPLLQQHMRSQQQRLLLKVLAAWCKVCHAAAMRHRMADVLAKHQRRRLQHAVLAALQDFSLHRAARRQQQYRANRHRAVWLLRSCWTAWKESIGEAHAAAAWQAQQSQQLLARAVFRWQQLSAAVTAAAAAEAVSAKVAVLRRRRELTCLRTAFTSWRVSVLVATEAAAVQQREEAYSELHRLQIEAAQGQQQLQGLPLLQAQQAELQQQLAAVNAAKADLECIIEAQRRQLQQEAADHQQQLAALRTEHQLGITVLQEQLQQACSNADETMHQLQRLQQQQTQAHMEQHSKHQQLEQQLARQKQELEQQAQQQLQQLGQQQQCWQQQVRQDQHLMQQLTASKAQCKELASQLKRCTEKLTQQTAAVQEIKAQLADTQKQLSAARAVSRDKSLSLTEKAMTAEHGRVQFEQQVQALQQQLKQQQELVQQHTAAKEASAASAAEQSAEVLRLKEQLAHRDDIIHQLRDSMGAVQAQLASQQAKVLSEVGQLRSGWSQAKQIIKQQRKTIKAQEQQLQLLSTSGWTTEASCRQQAGPVTATMSVQPTAQANARQEAKRAVTSGNLSLGGEAARGTGSSLKYPITSYVMQHQQHMQQPEAAAGDVPQTAGEAGSRSFAQRRGASSGFSFNPFLSQAGAGPNQPVQSSMAATVTSAAVAGTANARPSASTSAGVLTSPLGQQQQQRAMLTRTEELLHCTDEILRSLRAKAADY